MPGRKHHIEKIEEEMKKPDKLIFWAGIFMNNYILYLDMSCPDCQSDNTKKSGFVQLKTGQQQRYECKDCGRTWVGMGRPKIPVVGVSCDECHSDDIARKGWRTTRQGKIQQYVCRKCGHIFTLQPILKKRS